MYMYDIEAVKTRVAELNKYRDAYYNDSESLISDREYDQLFDELVEMEKQTGLILTNSPTRTVGYEVVSDLPKVTHEFPPMLSLDKSKELSDISKFINGKQAVAMAKMDGLTCRLTYHKGELVRAETRGDGETGEDVTHNIKSIHGIPLHLSPDYSYQDVIIDGEVIITRDNFNNIKEKFLDNKGKRYKNPRNFASGSIRLHDAESCAKRMLQFVAWKFVKGSTFKSFFSQLFELSTMGFDVTLFSEIKENCNTVEYLKNKVETLQSISEKLSYPIDGCVFSFDDVDYMESLGYTSHHSRAQIAFKFYDDTYDTVIRDIDWTMGKTGALTPTAIFDTVEIDGTDVSRANLHNLTIMKQLNVRKNCSAKVFKANMIIPQVQSVENDGVEDFTIPTSCPICGSPTGRIQENDSEVLMCLNTNCKGKLLGKLCTFVSKQGLDIDGLGENSLDLFIHFGFLTKLSDVFKLKDHYHFICNLDGWSAYSTDKLMDSIEAAKDVSLEKFIAALSIPKIGLTSAKTIAKHFDYDIEEFYNAITGHYAWSLIDGFGEKTEQDINDWYHDNKEEFENLLAYVRLKVQAIQSPVITDSPVSGKTFCITGTFNCGKREEIKTKLEALGGISVDGVTKKTDILFAGDKAGSKLKKAQDLNIIIYNEDKLVALLGE